jgi:hypothetical protein
MSDWRKTMDYEFKELLSQINTALDLESGCLKAGVELWEIREDADVEAARDSFMVGPIGFCERVKFCETVDEFVSTIANMSLSRKVMAVTLFKGSDDAFNLAFLRVLLGPDDNGKTNIDCNLIELLSQAYDNSSIKHRIKQLIGGGYEGK